MFRRYVLPRLVFWFFRIWSWTWRLNVDEPEALSAAVRRGEPLVFAHWHGQELCVLPLIQRWKIATMTSTSSDGQLIDFVIRRLGGATSRGSSTRGGVGALKGLVRLLRVGHNASMAVDGPKGPLHRVKPGVFELARLCHGHVVPTGVAAGREIIFRKSWNQAQLPRPFSRVRVVFGQPWEILPARVDVRSPELAAQLEDEISQACKLAGRRLLLKGPSSQPDGTIAR